MKCILGYERPGTDQLEAANTFNDFFKKQLPLPHQECSCN